MKKTQEKIRKGERGSVTLFVLVSMMFTTMFLLFAYTNQTNRINEQKRQIAQIQRRYSIDAMESVYQQALAQKWSELEIALYKANGEIYNTNDTTNEQLTLKIIYPDEIQDKYYYLDGTKTNYQEGQKITRNCVIKVQYGDYQKEVRITKINS